MAAVLNANNEVSTFTGGCEMEYVAGQMSSCDIVTGHEKEPSQRLHGGHR